MKHLFLTLLALIIGNSALSDTIDFEGAFSNGEQVYVENGMKLKCTHAIFMNYTGAGRKGYAHSAGHFFADGLHGPGKLRFLTQPVSLQYLHIAAAIPPGGQEVMLIGSLKGKEVGRKKIKVGANYRRINTNNWKEIDELAVYTPAYVGIRIDRIGYRVDRPNRWLAISDNADGTGDWDNPENWTEGVPSEDQDIIIPFIKTGRYPVTNRAISVKSLHIDPGARLILNHPLRISGAASGLEAIRGDGEVTVSGYVAEKDVDFGGIGVKLNAGKGNDLGKTTVTRTINRPPGEGLFRRAYLIKPTRTEGIAATLSFQCTTEEIEEIKEEGMSLYAHDGEGWKMAGGKLDEENSTLRLSGISHFSMWSVGKENLFPLDLLSFRQAEGNNSLHFTWGTSSETQVRGYVFQHLSEEEVGMSRYEDLAFIPGAGTTDKPQQYRYEARNLYPGKHVFRLKQVYTDGRFLYSHPVDLRVVQTPAFTMIFQHGISLSQSPILLQLTKHRSVKVSLVDEDMESRGTLYEGRMDAGPMYELRLPADIEANKTYFLKFYSESGAFFYQLNG